MFLLFRYVNWYWQRKISHPITFTLNQPLLRTGLHPRAHHPDRGDASIYYTQQTSLGWLMASWNSRQHIFISISPENKHSWQHPPPPTTHGLWSSGFRHDLNFSGLVYNFFHLFPNFNFVRAIKQFILHLKLFARSNLFIFLHIVWNIIRFKCIILLLQNKYALQWIIFLFSLNIIYFDWEFVIAIINVRFVK